MMASTKTIGSAAYAKFVHETSEIQDKVTTKRSENSAEGVGEEIKNKGFVKVYVDNAPSNFISFDNDAITGYWIKFDTIKEKEIKTGREELTSNHVTFGKEDVYIYDATGTVFYVKGWLDENDELHYRFDTPADENQNGPAISLVEYTLSSDKSKAIVKVTADPINGGGLSVIVGGIPAKKVGTNEYEAEIKENGTVMVVVTETGGGRSTNTINITGIEKPKDTTPPIITDLTSTQNGSNVVIRGSAKDDESAIVGYAFTSTSTSPSTWISVPNQSSISPSYTTSTSGTYYFWVKNVEGLVANSNITVNVVKTTYTITYNANGGTNAPASQTKTEGENITLSGMAPTREGYTFKGWATSSGSTNVEYQPSGTYTANANITLYAVWQPITYSVNYDANGGTGAPSAQQKLHGQTLTLSSTKPSRTGYTFEGWAIAKTSTTATYQAGGSYTIDANVTLYAVWKAKGYTVTYDANGGTGAPAMQEKTHGQNLTLSSTNPTRAGYTFLGWGVASTATTASYLPGELYTVDGDITLYAVWKANIYTVTYNANGGTSAPSAQTKTGDAALTLSSSTPSKTGYTFKGWATTSTATTAEYQPGDSYTKNENVTLYAIWGAEEYTITYNANGGTGAPEAQIKIAGQTLTLSSVKPTRNGYTFLGWSTSSIATTATYQPGGAWTASGDTILYAVWKAEVYTITYDANGGTTSTAPASQTKNYGIAITLSNKVPSRRRHIFKGWATTSTATTAEYQPEASYTANSSATLYAVWESTLIPSIANAPKLGTNMKATYWSDENATNEFTAASFSTSMYNYTIGNGVDDTKETKWANAKTEDGSYWVWIPRYAYRLVYYTNSTRTIESATKTAYGDVDVLFMYGTSNTQYRDINGNAQPLPEGYIVHPAFQKMTTAEDLSTNPLGKWDNELEGIWVAKYEASREDSTDSGATWLPTTASNGGSNTSTTNAGNASATQIRIVVKPSVTSWRSITQSNIYKNCENMYATLNSHQMKNSEWGAVAYLTYSAYGRNGNELAVNQCSSYYTGAGKGAGTSTIYNSTYSYTSASEFAENYAWNTELGKLASTTGNIYGVYDMSGGAYEYVASYITNGHSYLTSYGANMVNSTNLRNKQIYASTVSDGSSASAADYALASSIYGDAVYEISPNYNVNGWCSDYSNFPGGSSPFFKRGGVYYSTSNAGVFYFGSYNGGNGADGGFRPVLCVASGT